MEEEEEEDEEEMEDEDEEKMEKGDEEEIEEEEDLSVYKSSLYCSWALVLCIPPPWTLMCLFPATSIAQHSPTTNTICLTHIPICCPANCTLP
ncbi:hypothetical protein Pcinc_022768 [Petrolisthes cinctipes]|uniref:Uncharacterized protein n=1 Tax=Petrolisthes cinctipes TaxID=88211 RepID=A0AAE1KGN9_PETCI|nr:hypothetical protein Pcinc_022768 [Petrolisthes cinctipes]